GEDVLGLRGIPEGLTFELKRELPAEDALRRPDGWGASVSIGRDHKGLEDYAKEGIFRELVAFANTEGGWLVLGMEESAEQPKRATEPMPISDCRELAQRLQRAADDWLDPPVPGLR